MDYRQTSKQTGQTDRTTSKQANLQTSRQTGRQTDQTNKRTNETKRTNMRPLLIGQPSEIRRAVNKTSTRPFIKRNHTEELTYHHPQLLPNTTAGRIRPPAVVLYCNLIAKR